MCRIFFKKLPGTRNNQLL